MIVRSSPATARLIINGPTWSAGALIHDSIAFEYRGVRYYDYVPGHSYSPAIYGWAYSPWAIPVSYDWGWGLAPWLSGGYFAPEPYYRSATLWLTDYLIAANLQAAYQAGLKAGQAPADHSNAPPSGGPAATTQIPVSRMVKHMIANEVMQQLADEQTVATNPPPEPNNTHVANALNHRKRVLIVSINLSVSQADGQECELTPGDVIWRLGNAAESDKKVQVGVLSTKQNDCSVSVKPTVAADDLREMEDTFHEQLNSGLQMLAEKSGTGGLPKAPDTGTTSTDVPAPAAEVEVVDQLAALRVQADQAEYRAAQEAQSSGDLRAALALFQDLAGKPGPTQAQAQVRAQQVTQLIANANHSGGTVGIRTDRPRERTGVTHAMTATSSPNATVGAHPSRSPNANAIRSNPPGPKPAAPPKSTPPPPK